MLNRSIKVNCLRVARGIAPIDTGNLRYNAISGNNWSNPNKFSIRYSATDADYIKYLEENEFAGGSETKKNKHKDFILRTFFQIENNLNNYFNRGRIKKAKLSNFGESQENDRRIYRHNKSLDLYKLNREVNNNVNN